MTLSELNLSLFSWINASPEASNTSIHFAIFIANDLLYCMILLFAWFWLRGNYDTKKQILKAFIFTSIAILISQCNSRVLSPATFCHGGRTHSHLPCTQWLIPK